MYENGTNSGHLHRGPSMSVGKRRDERDGRRPTPARGTVQLEESQRSYDRQVEQLQDIDDKAMRSVRTAVLVIGFVVSAVGVTLRNGTVSLGLGPTLFTGLGVFFLTVTVVAGIGTYSITEYRSRLTDAERARLDAAEENGLKRNAELVRMYYSWLDATSDQITEQGAYLTTTLFALVFGVLSLLTAASLATVESLDALEHLTTLQIVVLEVATTGIVFIGVLAATRLSIKKVKTDT